MSRKVRLKGATAIVAVALAGAAPFHGVLAQVTYDRGVNENTSVEERPRPEYDPLGLRFGGFDVHPSVTLAVTNDDNVFASESDPREDIVMTMIPRVEIASHWSNHELRASVETTHTAYETYDDDNRTDIAVNASGRLDVRRSTQIGFAFRGQRQAEARTSPDAPSGSAEPTEFVETMTRVYGQHAVGRVRLSLAHEEDEFDFRDARTPAGAVIDQDIRDNTRRETTLRAEVALSPRIAFVAQTSRIARDFDADPPLVLVNRDSEGAATLLGVNFDLTRLARGEILVGQFDQDYTDPSLPDVRGAAVQGSVEWFPTMLTTVSAGARRSEDTSDIAGATSFVTERADLRVHHELRRNVILTGHVGREQRDYRGVAREDRVHEGEAAVRYLMNRRATVSAGVNGARQRSEGADRGQDFDIRRFFVALLLRL